MHMNIIKQMRSPEVTDSVTDSILWPFVFWLLIWIALIHVGTRLTWFIGFK